jgi:DNA replication protein DnaC
MTTDSDPAMVFEDYEYCPIHGVGKFEEAKEREREREAHFLQQRLDRIERVKDAATAQASIPWRFFEYTLEGSPLAQTRNALVKALSECNVDTSWLLWGPAGTGKTGLAAAYGKSLLNLGNPELYPNTVLFRSAPDLFTEIRASYNPRKDDDRDESDLLDLYSSVDLLIIDDLGKENINGSGWVEARLYQIINRRHGDMKPVFITSNLTPGELGARIGQPTMDRIIEMCGEDNIVNVRGENLRRKKAAS